MQKSFPLLLLIMALAAALSACGTPSGGRDGMPPGAAGGRNASRSAGGCQSVTEPIREQLRETAIALGLTPKQVVLWDNYQESISALMADQMKLSAYQTPHQNALQQIDSKVDTVHNRLAAMEDIADRAVALYQSLDEAQKKIADQRLAGTVPTLYSGLVCQGDTERNNEKSNTGPSGRGGPGGNMGGGMGRF